MIAEKSFAICYLTIIKDKLNVRCDQVLKHTKLRDGEKMSQMDNLEEVGKLTG